MNRRGFLKAVGITSAGALIVPNLRLIVPEELALTNETLWGKVRELVYYDIPWHGYVGRIDCLIKGIDEQWGVDFRFEGPSDLAICREQAAHLLYDTLRNKGFRPGDLYAPPIPFGYVPPQFTLVKL